LIKRTLLARAGCKTQRAGAWADCAVCDRHVQEMLLEGQSSALQQCGCSSACVQGM